MVRQIILSLKGHWTIDQIHTARLNGRAELCREVWQKTVLALKVVKEAHVRGICEWVEHHLCSSDSQPVPVEFTHCVPPCSSLSVMQLERRLVGS